MAINIQRDAPDDDLPLEACAWCQGLCAPGAHRQGGGHSAPAVVCSWCHVVMQPGIRPASHGICRSCLTEKLHEQLQLPDSRAA